MFIFVLDIFIFSFIFIFILCYCFAVIENVEIMQEIRKPLVLQFGDKIAEIDIHQYNKLFTVMRNHEITDIKCFDNTDYYEDKINITLTGLLSMVGIKHNLTRDEVSQIISFVASPKRN